MTQQQGNPGIERLCALAGVSRAGYYRHWQASAPRHAETALRDEIQRLTLANRHYGYRRITCCCAAARPGGRGGFDRPVYRGGLHSPTAALGAQLSGAGDV